MKNLIKKLSLSLLLLSIITISGFIIPLIVTIFITITTEATITDCVTTIPFWLFVVIGWMVFLSVSYKFMDNKLYHNNN